MECYHIDIKSDGEVASVAIAEFLCAVEQARAGGYSVMKVLHGYGSHGVGGVIKSELTKQLKMLKAQRKICDYYFGNKIGVQARQNLINRCAELYIDKDLYNLNAGICFVCL